MAVTSTAYRHGFNLVNYVLWLRRRAILDQQLRFVLLEAEEPS